MEIIFKKAKPKLFWQKWNEYLKNNIASYQYLPNFLNYMLYYSKNLYVDESFVLIQDKKPLAICFLPIEKNIHYKTITIANDYVCSPLANNKKIEKQVYNIIEKIAKKEKIAIIKFYLEPLIMEYANKFSCLQKYGYINSSSISCLLDLRQEKKELWLNLRKSYRGIIKKLLENKDFKLVIIDKDNVNFLVHEKYRKLHRLCAGKITRVKKTFDYQFKMLKDDNAIIIGLQYKKRFIGFSYFFHYNKTAIYASGVDNPTYNRFPLYHIMIWQAINYYKKRGLEFIQLPGSGAYNLVNGFDDYFDQKLLNIAFFKRGFEGKMVPFPRGIKYYNKNKLREDLKIFRMRALKTL